MSLTSDALKPGAHRPELQAMFDGLPHRYGWDWYQWAWDFYTTTNKMALLCAANQISKSSTQIRKAIEWAGNPALWEKLWPGRKPKTFWYLYPDGDTATAEFENKWVDFLPRGAYIDHKTLGWKLVRGEKRVVNYIEFNSGVRIYFKFYSQQVKNLQSGTVDAIFCFPANTLVLTPRGAVPIQDLKVGDLVIAGDGSIQRIRRAISRESEVITRQFSNGESVTATPDHPFWTKNRGWVEFQHLTTTDQCGTVRAWKLIKNWSCLKASFFHVFQRAKTRASEITSEIVVPGFCMSLFGSLCMDGGCPRGMLSTIETKTRSTIAQRILSCLRVPSTPDFTKKLSGRKRDSGISFASGAVVHFSREAPKEQLQGFARKAADGHVNGANAFGAKMLSRLAKSLRSVSVLSSAPTVTKPKSARVYNLEVEGPHTYFADGFLVHNCDEELPEELYPELSARLFGTDGYFHMVFTATLNQDFWKLAIEGDGDQEKFPDAFKLQVSMRDCITYRNGKPGAFTEERIRTIEASCKNETERMRRVDGRFITEGGRKYPQYEVTRHLKTPFPIPGDWRRYVGVDLGSGGKAHPPAICFIAVRPDCRLGVIYKGWKGDDGPIYTNGDVFNKFLDLRGRDLCVLQKFDQQAKDFGTIASRAGESFLASDKSHERGEDVINTLFKNDMLFLFDTPEIQKLGAELSSLMKSTPKKKAKDDFCDAMRYGIVDIPWDWSALKGEQTEDEKKAAETRPYTNEELVAMELADRRGQFVDSVTGRKPGEDPGWDELEEEFRFWNDFAAG